MAKTDEKISLPNFTKKGVFVNIVIISLQIKKILLVI